MLSVVAVSVTQMKGKMMKRFAWLMMLFLAFGLFAYAGCGGPPGGGGGEVETEGDIDPVADMGAMAEDDTSGGGDAGGGADDDAAGGGDADSGGGDADSGGGDDSGQ